MSAPASISTCDTRAGSDHIAGQTMSALTSVVLGLLRDKHLTCCRRTSNAARGPPCTQRGLHGHTHSARSQSPPALSQHAEEAVRGIHRGSLCMPCAQHRRQLFRILGKLLKDRPHGSRVALLGSLHHDHRLLKAFFFLVGSHPVCCLRVASALCVCVLLLVSFVLDFCAVCLSGENSTKSTSTCNVSAPECGNFSYVDCIIAQNVMSPGAPCGVLLGNAQLMSG